MSIELFRGIPGLDQGELGELVTGEVHGTHRCNPNSTRPRAFEQRQRTLLRDQIRDHLSYAARDGRIRRHDASLEHVRRGGGHARDGAGQRAQHDVLPRRQFPRFAPPRALLQLLVRHHPHHEQGDLARQGHAAAPEQTPRTLAPQHGTDGDPDVRILAGLEALLQHLVGDAQACSQGRADPRGQPLHLHLPQERQRFGEDQTTGLVRACPQPVAGRRTHRGRYDPPVQSLGAELRDGTCDVSDGGSRDGLQARLQRVHGVHHEGGHAGREPAGQRGFQKQLLGTGLGRGQRQHGGGLVPQQTWIGG
mmetsp:Transcript_7821/g.48508  ORF Transcript_7821/g.48508 Transcript_7821/m.48508 type:complete len:307 (-) Transcript_7821:700-1620(-)